MNRIALIAAMVLGTSALADDHAHNMIRTSDLEDATLYTAATSEGYMWDVSATFTEVNDNWSTIGDVEDLVLDADGNLMGIIAEVGGFLDIGDKHVLIKLDEMKFFNINEADEEPDYVIVTGLSKDRLMDREDLDELW